MKTNKTIAWGLTGLISLAFLGSAVGKFMANEEALKMAETFGIDASTYLMIGVVELFCLLLFIIPRTGILVHCRYPLIWEALLPHTLSMVNRLLPRALYKPFCFWSLFIFFLTYETCYLIPRSEFMPAEDRPHT